ncbi:MULTISPECIES: hypothetical protein [Pseudomonas]|jgi:hypothetical protein|uniref:hypothetical protein n=1 Tax=Pseudomonas TaxID=286 RepID=UPI00070E94C6|nr:MULTISPECIES: hypothetical protein [Pseudomonas]MBD8184997.1 hypothetical protein [Pseudomonas viridiflava]MBD8201691.1 hypothetical protein [Pseudomonas viridiflava]MBP0940211.1 hypothetical protein [Pseudomonas alliivorans]MEE4877602.1 hypothetical protein [Pseudomonas alliivorans]MEE4929419.1 hypothetical protein [Pseudomonas alliivorans]
MKDSIALLATAVVMAVLAWLFWAGLGEDAFGALSVVMMVILAVDNFRLRRQVKALITGATQKR